MRGAFSSCLGRLNLDYIIFVYRLNSQVPVYIVNVSLSTCHPVILQEFSHAALAAASSPVIGGPLTGHGVATVIDVLGGSLVGTFLSEMVVTHIVGPVLMMGDDLYLPLILWVPQGDPT
ncbi:hypothetical protein Peur_003499 [Populus x canadensis]